MDLPGGGCERVAVPPGVRTGLRKWRVRGASRGRRRPAQGLRNEAPLGEPGARQRIHGAEIGDGGAVLIGKPGRPLPVAGRKQAALASVGEEREIVDAPLENDDEHDGRGLEAQERVQNADAAGQIVHAEGIRQIPGFTVVVERADGRHVLRKRLLARGVGEELRALIAERVAVRAAAVDHRLDGLRTDGPALFGGKARDEFARAVGIAAADIENLRLPALLHPLKGLEECRVFREDGAGDEERHALRETMLAQVGAEFLDGIADGLRFGDAVRRAGKTQIPEPDDFVRRKEAGLHEGLPRLLERPHCVVRLVDGGMDGLHGKVALLRMGKDFADEGVDLLLDEIAVRPDDEDSLRMGHQ